MRAPLIHVTNPNIKKSPAMITIGTKVLFLLCEFCEMDVIFVSIGCGLIELHYIFRSNSALVLIDSLNDLNCAQDI